MFFYLCEEIKPYFGKGILKTIRRTTDGRPYKGRIKAFILWKLIKKDGLYFSLPLEGKAQGSSWKPTPTEYGKSGYNSKPRAPPLIETNIPKVALDLRDVRYYSSTPLRRSFDFLRVRSAAAASASPTCLSPRRYSLISIPSSKQNSLW